MKNSSRTSLWAETVTVEAGRATITGEVWLGPIAVGAMFSAVATATTADPVQLRLDSLTAPSDAQEPGRVERVVAVVSGLGVEHLRPGVVLLGEAS